MNQKNFIKWENFLPLLIYLFDQTVDKQTSKNAPF